MQRHTAHCGGEDSTGSQVAFSDMPLMTRSRQKIGAAERGCGRRYGGKYKDSIQQKPK